MVEIIAKIAAMFIPGKKYRRKFRDKVKTFFYGFKVLTKAESIGKNFVCGGKSLCSRTTIIKDNVRMNGVSIQGFGKVTIGNYAQLGTDILIISQNHNYDKGTAIPYDHGDILKDVEIGDFVWVGSRAVILPGSKIGEGAIIQAGAVVHGEIPPYAIAGGNPAKVFKYRDIEHFKKLKANKSFIEYYF